MVCKFCPAMLAWASMWIAFRSASVKVGASPDNSTSYCTGTASWCSRISCVCPVWTTSMGCPAADTVTDRGPCVPGTFISLAVWATGWCRVWCMVCVWELALLDGRWDMRAGVRMCEEGWVVWTDKVWRWNVSRSVMVCSSMCWTGCSLSVQWTTLEGTVSSEGPGMTTVVMLTVSDGCSWGFLAGFLRGLSFSRSGSYSVWLVRWELRYSLRKKALLQNWHWYFLMPVWVCSCRLRLPARITG